MNIRKKINLFLITGILFSNVFTACKMDLFSDFDHTPIIELTSIETSNDTTTVTGKVVDDGDSYIEYVGFCYDLIGNPGLEEHQIIIDKMYNNGTFNTTFYNLNTDSIYYFRAFGINKYEYALSPVKAYQPPISGPPDVPCTLNNNMIVDNGSSYSVTSVSSSTSDENYELSASCYNAGGPTVYFYFNKLPVNGIYKTVSDEINIGRREVCVKENKGNEGIFIMNSNDNVYVENTGDSLIVSFCELTYGTSNYILQGKFYKVLN